jgi:hypothetical protein
MHGFSTDEAEHPVSRHHILPPILTPPEPPKPKETKRRRRVGGSATDGVDETEETSEFAQTPSAKRPAVLPQHNPPVEATERRDHSTTGHLSDGTLKAMLEMQEKEGGQAAGADVHRDPTKAR